MRKVYSDAGAALAGLLHDNMTIVAGGFGLSGGAPRPCTGTGAGAFGARWSACT